MIRLDYAEVERNYAAMPESAFSQLRRSELTTEAAAIYDRELNRRSPDLALKMRQRDAAEAAAALLVEALEPADDPKPTPGLMTVLATVVFVITLIPLAMGFTPKHPGSVAALSVSAAIGWSRYGAKRQAWLARRKEREDSWSARLPRQSAITIQDCATS